MPYSGGVSHPMSEKTKAQRWLLTKGPSWDSETGVNQNPCLLAPEVTFGTERTQDQDPGSGSKTQY